MIKVLDIIKTLGMYMAAVTDAIAFEVASTVGRVSSLFVIARLTE